MTAILKIVRYVLEADDDFDAKEIVSTPSEAEQERERLQSDSANREASLMIAGDPQTPPRQLSILLKSSDPDVVQAAIKNRSTPILDILEILPNLDTSFLRPVLPNRVKIASGVAEKARLKRRAREALGAANGTPVIIKLNSSSPPEWAGRGYYWTTPSGKTEVKYPNAYGWPTWYHHSTRKIIVGSGWLANPYGHGL